MQASLTCNKSTPINLHPIKAEKTLWELQSKVTAGYQARETKNEKIDTINLWGCHLEVLFFPLHNYCNFDKNHIFKKKVIYNLYIPYTTTIHWLVIQYSKNYPQQNQMFPFTPEVRTLLASNILLSEWHKALKSIIVLVDEVAMN